MAQYIFEKGDDAEVRRYSYPRWREFAERPEVGLTRTESASLWCEGGLDAVTEY